MQTPIDNDNFVTNEESDLRTENSNEYNSKSEVIRIKKRSGVRSTKFYLGFGFIILLLVSILVYGFYFKDSKFLKPMYLIGDDSEGGSSSNKVDKAPFVNPINGVLIESHEAEKFRDVKPIAVMVNNFVAARPSDGLSSADVVYEAVAEGGITRLMPIFFSKIPEKVESIRSARYYFAEFAAGYKAHFIHWGAAHRPPCEKEPSTSSDYCAPVNGKVETNPEVDAYERIVQLGVPNLDAGNYACEEDADDCVFSRNPEKVGKVSREHTAFARLPLIYDFAKKIRVDSDWHKYVPIQEWKFKDDAPLEERGEVGVNPPISFNYWDLDNGFDVKWEYDKENNEYVRFQGGKKQIDASNNKELRAKTVIVRLTTEKSAGDRKNHLMYKLLGKGAVLIFQDGKVIKGFWQRDAIDERDIFIDQDGDEIELVRGQIWVQVVPQGKEISYGEDEKEEENEGESSGSTEADTEENNERDEEGEGS